MSIIKGNTKHKKSEITLCSDPQHSSNTVSMKVKGEPA